jgi:tRNA modification GTPase
VIEVHLDLDGYPVTVIDTAGIRETDDPVEQEGVRRARMRAGEADLVLWMIDAQHEMTGRGDEAPVWVVRNKIDVEEAGEVAGISPEAKPGTQFKISARLGDGVAELIEALVAFARDYFGSKEDGLIGRHRQRELLRETVASLRRSISVVHQGEELAAEELRAAANSLGRLLGRVDVEDVLDVIFREFCVGK